MPIIEPSDYPAPRFPRNSRHWQTIYPSFARREELPENIEREEFPTPDGDILLLDWARVGSGRLAILSHGLCGSSRRHYILSLVRAFNKAGWDCLAWNFRGTGASPGLKCEFTTQNSTNELHWITRHALESGHYGKIAYSGYSMGGNLTALYLCREDSKKIPQICGAALFCATTDMLASTLAFHSFMGRIYAWHFLKDMTAMIRRKAEAFPGRFDTSMLKGIRYFEDFDDRFTAPYLGLKDSRDYYRTASSCRFFSQLKVPLLLVAPKNDPFLAGECYPVEEARRNPMLFLEMPEGGGHCGFPTPKGQEWWPARRAVSFLQQCCD